MKDETISTKDAFNCKHLLPCGMCDKTDKPCSHTPPKGTYMCIKAKCKKCGNPHQTAYSLADTQTNWEKTISRYYATVKCAACGGEMEITRRYPIDESGNEL